MQVTTRKGCSFCKTKRGLLKQFQYLGLGGTGGKAELLLSPTLEPMVWPQSTSKEMRFVTCAWRDAATDCRGDRCEAEQTDP
jgi:hypothetical protein